MLNIQQFILRTVLIQYIQKDFIQQNMEIILSTRFTKAMFPFTNCIPTNYKRTSNMCFVVYVCVFIYPWLVSRTISAQAVVDQDIGNHTALVGESITLMCDLRAIGGNPIVWYHVDRMHVLSLDDTVQDSVPLQIRERLSVTCYPDYEWCELTISQLTIEDGGTYKCGHQYGSLGQVKYFTTGYLNVIYSGSPPSEESPTCLIYADGNRPESRSGHAVGDTVTLSCTVTGAETAPFLVWKRISANIEQDFNFLLYATITLTEDDMGIDFTCIMTHPALNEPRNCTVTPLPLPTTSDSNELITSPRFTKAIIPQYTTEITPSGLQAYIIPIVVSVVIFIILLCLVVAIILCITTRRKIHRKNDLSTKADDKRNMGNETANTSDYAAINSMELIPESHELEPIRTSAQSQGSTQDLQEDRTSTDAQICDDGNFPVYATPDKKRKKYEAAEEEVRTSHYENVPPLSSQATEECSSQDGLMYADIDLTDKTTSDSPRMPLSNQDATVYADITA